MRAKRGAKEHGDAGGSVHATGAARLRLRRSDDVLSAFELQLSALSCNGGKQPPFWLAPERRGHIPTLLCYICMRSCHRCSSPCGCLGIGCFLSFSADASIGRSANQSAFTTGHALSLNETWIPSISRQQRSPHDRPGGVQPRPRSSIVWPAASRVIHLRKSGHSRFTGQQTVILIDERQGTCSRFVCDLMLETQYD